MDKPEKKRKRLAVDVPLEMHNQLKYIAIVRNCTIRKLVLRALHAFIKYESKFN